MQLGPNQWLPAPLVLLLLCLPARTQILRAVPRASASLSSTEFARRASLGTPFVLREAAARWPAMNWTREYLSAACSPAQFVPKVVKEGSTSWAQLHSSEKLWSLKDFLESMQCSDSPAYLHDERICSFCPAISGDFEILEHWSENFLLDVVRPGATCGLSEYVHAWPALFIGGNLTETRLHQDHLGTSFWYRQALFSGL